MLLTPAAHAVFVVAGFMIISGVFGYLWAKASIEGEEE